MYGIFAYIWLICIPNVGKYTIHGSSGKCKDLLVFHKIDPELQENGGRSDHI